jgi:hypothetical protein
MFAGYKTYHWLRKVNMQDNKLEKAEWNKDVEKKEYPKHPEASDVDETPTDPVPYGAPNICHSIKSFVGSFSWSLFIWQMAVSVSLLWVIYTTI